MNKQFRNLLIMICLLVCLIGAFFAVQHFNTKQEEKKEAALSENDIVLSSHDISEINEFSYLVSGNKIAYVKENDCWKAKEDPALELDQDKLSDMAQKTKSVVAKRVLTGDEIDLEGFGLTNPVNEITVTTKKGTETYTFGNENEMTNQYYMIVNHDESKVYVIGTSIPETLNVLPETLKAEKPVSENKTESQNAAAENMDIRDRIANEE